MYHDMYIHVPWQPSCWQIASLGTEPYYLSGVALRHGPLSLQESCIDSTNKAYSFATKCGNCNGLSSFICGNDPKALLGSKV